LFFTPTREILKSMVTLEITLPDQTVMILEQVAQKLGLTLEQLLQISIEEKLARLDKDFLEAAAYVIVKNAELYRRLA
jgi:antitoxin FitA